MSDTITDAIPRLANIWLVRPWIYRISTGQATHPWLGAQLEVTQVPAHLQNYIDYEAYGRDVAIDENGAFTDQGYVRDTGDSFHEYYDGERGSITISAKNVFMAASRVSGRVWSLVRITIPNDLKSVKIRVEKPQNNSLYPYFQREPL